MEANEMRLPDFLIIGVGRGGTSSLFENLARHPRIQRPIGESYHGKELGYFSKNYNYGPEWYSSKFPERKPGCLLFEATPTYISDPAPVQKRIRELLPGVKAILLLRNPTARAWSEFSLKFMRPPYSDKIKKLFDPKYHIVQRGMYIGQILRWHRLFPKENLLILKSEDYFADMPGTLEKVYGFLSIENICPIEFSAWDPWANKKAKWGYPSIPANVKKWLDDFYGPYNERLSEYLDKDFMWRKI
jgi:hypothetical protein